MYSIAFFIFLVSCTKRCALLKVSEILDEQANSIRVVGGSGKNKFAVLERMKTRHLIYDELLSKLQSIENIKVTVNQLDDDALLNIKKSSPLEDDLLSRVVVDDDNGHIEYATAHRASSFTLGRFQRCIEGNETELKRMISPLASEPQYASTNKTSCLGHRSSFGGPLSLENCTVKWYSAPELCAEMEANNLVIFLVGDSSVRQMAESLVMILMNDFVTGAVEYTNDMSKETKLWCRCDGYNTETKSAYFSIHIRYHLFSYFICSQFDDNHALKTSIIRARRCYHYSAMKNEWDKFCPQFSVRRIVYIPCWDARRLDVAKCLPNLRNQLAQYESSNVFIYASIGIHFGLKFEKLGTLLHLKVAEEVQSYINRTKSFATTITGLVHTCDIPRKPAHYSSEQCGPRIEPFNTALREFVKSSDQHYLFDAELYTSGTLSIDGLNYGLKTMIPMAQLLLNYIIFIFGKK